MRASRLPALLMACASLLAACSGTASSGAPTVAAPSTTTSAAPSTVAESPAASTEASAAPSASAAAASGTLAVTAKDFAFDLPATVEAGVTSISLNNTGAEAHQAQLVKIADGHSLSDVVVGLAGDPAAALGLVTLDAGPNNVTPGATGTSTVNLEPGQYAFICFLRGADGIPHFAKGMVAPLNVTGTASSGTLPAGDAKLTLKDFAFDLNKLSTGKHTVTVTNSGPQSHEAGIVKLNDGVTVESAIKALSAAPAPSAPPSPPPWTEVGGINAIAPNTTANFDVDLPAGNYAFVCFVPDAKTGKPHLLLGMIGALTVQ